MTGKGDGRKTLLVGPVVFQCTQIEGAEPRYSGVSGEITAHEIITT